MLKNTGGLRWDAFVLEKIENVMQKLDCTAGGVCVCVCVPGWSSWGRRPISWRLSEATPAPRPSSSRPHASPTLWLSPAAWGPAYFYPSSFPAGWGSITQDLCWCETPTQMIHSRRWGRERWRWCNAQAVFMVDSAPCGRGGKVAAVRWPRRVQAGLIAGLLNGSSVGFRRCQCADKMLPLPPPFDSPLFAHWESIMVHFRDWAYTWLPSRGAEDHGEISDLKRWGSSKYAHFLPLGHYCLEEPHNKTLCSLIQGQIILWQVYWRKNFYCFTYLAGSFLIWCLLLNLLTLNSWKNAWWKQTHTHLCVCAWLRFMQTILNPLYIIAFPGRTCGD